MDSNFLISLPLSFKEWFIFLVCWFLILWVFGGTSIYAISKGLGYVFIKIHPLIDRFGERIRDQKHNKLYFDNESGKLAYVLSPYYYEHDGKRHRSDRMEEIRIVDTPGRHKKTREERVVYYRESGSGGGSVSTTRDRSPVAMITWDYIINNDNRWGAFEFLSLGRESQAKEIFRKLVSDSEYSRKDIRKVKKIEYHGLTISFRTICLFGGAPTSVREVDYTI